jgi:hypothetical protein
MFLVKLRALQNALHALIYEKHFSPDRLWETIRNTMIRNIPMQLSPPPTNAIPSPENNDASTVTVDLDTQPRRSTRKRKNRADVDTTYSYQK